VEIGELTRIGIHVDHHFADAASAAKSARIVHNGASYKTLNWVRPRLVGGRPVWPVEWSEDEYAWIPVDRKRSRPLE
jgi:hypothetical protein